MRPTPFALALAATLVLPFAAEGQAADTVRWSLFTGRSLSTATDADRTYAPFVENFGVGASVEFMSSLFPVPVRAALAWDKFRGGPSTTYKVTSLRLEGMFRPIPPVMGIRPYLLGGFGIATQSPTGMQTIDNGVPTFVPIARHSALQLNAGAGLEFRRFFMEYRRSPFTVAGSMPPQAWQMNLGLRF